MKRWLMTLLLLPSLAVAEDSAVVRAELLPDDIEVGNSATLRITVLGPTWFPKAPVFPSLEVPNALVELPPNSSMSAGR